MLPRSTTPATPATSATTNPALAAHAAGASQPSGSHSAQHRQRLTRPLAAVVPAQATAPAQPARPAQRPLPPTSLTPTSAEWRRRSVELAWRGDRGHAARYIGRSARGLDSYVVPSARIGGLDYIVTLHQDADGHHWNCQCYQGAQQKPCSHVGAALLLAGHRAEVVEALAAAVVAQYRWGHVKHAGASADGCAFYLVPREPQLRLWDTVVVTWDPRPQRDVAVRCSCEEVACPHIGAVALRREHDRQQQERRQRYGEPAWEFIQSAAL